MEQTCGHFLCIFCKCSSFDWSCCFVLGLTWNCSHQSCSGRWWTWLLEPEKLWSGRSCWKVCSLSENRDQGSLRNSSKMLSCEDFGAYQALFENCWSHNIILYNISIRYPSPLSLSSRETRKRKKSNNCETFLLSKCTFGIFRSFFSLPKVSRKTRATT